LAVQLQSLNNFCINFYRSDAQGKSTEDFSTMCMGDIKSG